MKRGDVYWAELVPAQDRNRPVDAPLLSFPTTASIERLDGDPSLSSQYRGPHLKGSGDLPVVEISGATDGLAKTSFAVCHQVTTLDRVKLSKRVGNLQTESMREVEAGLKAAMDLD